MKRFTGIASALVLLASPMFGSSKKPQTIDIRQAVQVGTTNVPAGTYKLAWTGAGQEVQATLTTQKGKPVVTFAAKATDSKNTNTGIGINTVSGVTKLETIYLNDVSLQVEPAPQPGQ